METDYIYGVARIRAIEGTLFSDDTITSLLQCSDYEQCLNFLRDKGWGNGSPDQSLEEMISGEKNKTKPAKLEIFENEKNKAYITITEGKYHQVKRMFAAIGLTVTFLKRISMGSLVLDEALKPGEYRKLTTEEVSALHDY